jgi:hypothetical protein
LAKLKQQPTTRCRPNSKNKKTELKLSLIVTRKNGEKGHRPVGHRSVEWHLGLYLQQNVHPRVGRWLKDAGRRLLEDQVIG